MLGSEVAFEVNSTPLKQRLKSRMRSLRRRRIDQRYIGFILRTRKGNSLALKVACYVFPSTHRKEIVEILSYFNMNFCNTVKYPKM